MARVRMRRGGKPQPRTCSKVADPSRKFAWPTSKKGMNCMAPNIRPTITKEASHPAALTLLKVQGGDEFCASLLAN